MERPKSANCGIDGLIASLEQCRRRTSEEWLQSLGTRKREELTFHDAYRADDRAVHAAQANAKYYAVAHATAQYVERWLEARVRGKVFLDYACGNGEMAMKAAQRGAALAIGLDISPVSVDLAGRTARAAGLESTTFFLQGDCEHTGLPDSCIDVMLCSGMLHHLDLSYAFPEIRRILKPGGVALAMEALNYNPLIRLYRMLTPQLRTDWEKRHILSLKHVRFARWFFDVRNIRYWHLFSLAAVPFRKTFVFPTVLGAATALDWLVLRLPLLRLLAWMFSFELVRREDS